MNNQFFNQMFNPQYFNRDYYYTYCPQQPQVMPPTWVQQQQEAHESCQQAELSKLVKAFEDFLKASQKLDAQHQQIAFCACLNLIAAEQNWQ